MKEEEIKELDIDLTAILRQLSVLEKELQMVEEEINNLNNDVKSGHISNKAAEKINAKFVAERESLRSAIKSILEKSIDTAKQIQLMLDGKIKKFE